MFDETLCSSVFSSNSWISTSQLIWQSISLFSNESRHISRFFYTQLKTATQACLSLVISHSHFDSVKMSLELLFFTTLWLSLWIITFNITIFWWIYLYFNHFSLYILNSISSFVYSWYQGMLKSIRGIRAC